MPEGNLVLAPQNFIQRLVVQILLQQKRIGRGKTRILHRDRDVVGIADTFNVNHFVSGVQPQMLLIRCGGFFNDAFDDFGAGRFVLQPACIAEPDRLGNIFLNFVFCNECAFTRNPHQVAFRGECIQGGPDRYAAYLIRFA
ncbi:hypothetical protein D3C73_1164790 [compost metagenome]